MFHNGMSNNEQDYEMCFRVENVVLPKNGYFGVTAATGGLAGTLFKSTNYSHNILIFIFIFIVKFEQMTTMRLNSLRTVYRVLVPLSQKMVVAKTSEKSSLKNTRNTKINFKNKKTSKNPL